MSLGLSVATFAVCGLASGAAFKECGRLLGSGFGSEYAITCSCAVYSRIWAYRAYRAWVFSSLWMVCFYSWTSPNAIILSQATYSR